MNSGVIFRRLGPEMYVFILEAPDWLLGTVSLSNSRV